MSKLSTPDQLLELGDYFLVTLKKPYKGADGAEYLRIWGETHHHQEAGRMFVKVGGFGNEVLISPDMISYVECVGTRPTGPDILILGNEYDEFRPAGASS